MIRLYLPEKLRVQHTLTLQGETHHYLTRVLRNQVGDTLRLFNGEHDEHGYGIEWQAEIVRIEKNSLTLNILHSHQGIARPKLNISLVQALSKGEKMDYSIQKAVELGVSEILICGSERSVLRLKTLEEREKKLVRWQQIIVHACQQSGRCDVPRLAYSESIFCDLGDTPQKMGLLLDPHAQNTVRTVNLQDKQRIYVAIGAEGGWSATELSQAVACGWLKVALGQRVLRTETAGLAILAALQACWGDF